jgi:hypothetical protein
VCRLFCLRVPFHHVCRDHLYLYSSSGQELELVRGLLKLVGGRGKHLLLVGQESRVLMPLLCFRLVVGGVVLDFVPLGEELQRLTCLGIQES